MLFYEYGIYVLVDVDVVVPGVGVGEGSLPDPSREREGARRSPWSSVTGDAGSSPVEGVGAGVISAEGDVVVAAGVGVPFTGAGVASGKSTRTRSKKGDIRQH